MNKQPDISVIIPVSGRFNYLARSLETLLRQHSLRAALTAELIIVDNARTEELRTRTKQACSAALSRHGDARVHLKYIVAQHPNPQHRNAGYVRNCGLRLCSSTIVLMADADVLHVSESLSQHWYYHSRCDDLLVFSYCRDCPADIPLGRLQLQAALRDMRFPLRMAHATDWFGSMCCSARRSRLWAVDGFEERFRRWGYEDYDLARRLRMKGITVIRDDGILTLHQQHASAAGGGWLMKLYAGWRLLVRIQKANHGRKWGQCDGIVETIQPGAESRSSTDALAVAAPSQCTVDMMQAS